MSLSGTINGSFSNMLESRTRPRIVWSATQSISGNYSNVTATLYFDKLHADWGWHYNLSGFTAGITINGNSGTKSATYDLRSSSTVTIMSRTVKVNHNSDGNKSITISASGHPSNSVGSISLSKTVSLKSIPRASTLSAFSFNANLKTGTSNRINYTISRKHSNYRHQFQVRNGSTTVLEWNNISSNGSTYLTLNASDVNKLLDSIGNSTSKTFTLRVATRSGVNGGWIGSASTRDATATVDSSVKPSIGSISIDEAVAGLKSQFGAYIQHNSRLAISMSPSAGRGATIKSRSITVNGVSYNSNTATSSVLTNSGDVTVSFSVTDNRNRTTSDSRTITVSSYQPPNPIISSLNRTNSSGVLDDNGAYATAKFTSSPYSLGGKNPITYSFRYKRADLSTWTTRTTYSTTSSHTFHIGTDYTYQIEYTVSDFFGTYTAYGDIGATFSLINFAADGKGIAFGKVHERGLLDIDGEAYFNDLVHFEGGIQSQRVPRGTNLNDIKRTGFYYNPLNNDVGTMTNTPHNHAFSLIVEQTAGIKQTWTRFGTGSTDTWMRQYYSGNWGTWYKII